MKESADSGRTGSSRRITWLLATAWLVLLSGSLVWEYWHTRAHVEELARIEARASFNKDMAYRRWATSHGGVYVPPTPQTPPNPYLAVTNRDVTTTSGQALTLINPAYMTRQVYEMDTGEIGTRSHITSLKPIRPENAADAWETNALRAFTRGFNEVSSIELMGGQPYMRLMRPMRVEAGCLKCHASQGYQEGQIRGGISVSVRMAPYFEIAKVTLIPVAVVHLLLGGVGIAGLWLARRKFQVFLADINKHETEILRMNRLYLALSQVNQLITRVKTRDELLSGVCQVLVQYGGLKVAWIGKHNSQSQAVLPVACHGDESAYLREINVYADERPEGKGPVGTSIREGRTVVCNDMLGAALTRPWHAAAARHGLASLASFPIREQGQVWGSLAVYSSEPDFFRDKEVLLFEEAAADVSFAIDHLEQEARKQRAEEELRKTTEELDRYFTSALDLLCVADTKGYFKRLNPQWQKCLGYSLAELKGKQLLEWVHPDDRESTLQVLSQLSEQQPVVSFVNRYRHKHGTYRWIEWRSFPQGEWIYAVARDVTEHRQAMEALKASEAALRASEQEFRTLAEAMPQLVWMCLPDGWNIYFNQRWVDYTGLTLEESYGHGWNTPFHPDHKQRAWDAWRKATQTGETYDLECQLRKADDSYRWFIIRGLPLRDSSGQIVKWIGTCTDIDNHKQAEESLRHSEEKFATAFANNPSAMALTRLEDGLFFDVNTTWSILTGYSRQEAIGNFARTMNIWPSREASDRFVTKLKKQGSLRDWEQEFLKKSGEIFTAQLSAQIILMHGERMILSTLVDITERKKTERQLMHSHQLMHYIIAHARSAIAVHDRQLRYVFVSERYLQEYKLKERDIIGRHHYEVFPDLPQKWRDVHQRALAGEVSSAEEDPYVREDGSVEWTRWECRPWYESSGSIGGFIIYTEVITERKLLEEQLRQAQKLESIGQLAGGVAHDFNNILAAILMQMDLLRLNPGLDQETQATLRELTAEATRAANLTRQLLMFSRRSVLETRALDLNEVVANLLKMLRRLIGEHITIQFVQTAGLPTVQADPGMMEQVIMNLAVNARDAMANGGVLTIRLEALQVEESRAQLHAGARPGQFVCLSVTDTGCGMDDGTLQHMFEPFFTTKEVGKGTGLGLATVHGIIGQHKGWVEVESKIGEGATFRVFLPAATQPSDDLAPGKHSQTLQGQETILLVEDEQSVRRVAARSLRLLGYKVIEAGSGPDALALWSEHQDQIDLLLSDMIMPGGINGVDLAEKLRKMKPRLKVIISSGYSTEMVVQGVPKEKYFHLLQKPFQIDLLSKTVRQCLDETWQAHDA